METIDFIVVCLAVWRVGQMMSDPYEDGPFDLLHHIRNWIGAYYDENSELQGKNVIAKMLICIKCNTFWFGVLSVLALVVYPELFIIVCVPFAINTVAIIIDSIVE